MIRFTRPLLVAAMAAIVAPLALMGPSSARLLNWDRIPLGYVLSREEIVANLGPSAVRTGVANESRSSLALPAFEATRTRRTRPAWLFFSNSPEVLSPTSMPKRRGLLASADVPAGEGRVLVSHANLHPLPQDFVLRMTNLGDLPAEVVLDPRVSYRQSPISGTWRMDAAVGGALATDFLRALKAGPPLGWRPPDGEKKRIIRQRETSDAVLVSDVRGLGMALASITTSESIRLSVYSVPAGCHPEADTPVLPRTGSQVRGLFQEPDQEVEATVDLSDGKPRRWVFGEAERDNALGVLDGGNWMAGEDATATKAPEKVTNRGDFGGITWIRATVKGAPPAGGALFVLVAGGRKAAVVSQKDGRTTVIPQWSGIVVGKARTGDSWEYAFTLPPNSWAPVYLVAVPIHAL